MGKPLPQVWAVCQPKKDVLDESFLVSELALDLYAVARGKASPPYDNAVSFLEATEITSAIGSILRDVLGRLGGSKRSVNPVIVFDVGFGGGKTHAMATLFYAGRDGKKAEVKKLLGDVPIPSPTPTIVAISGDEYGGKGVQRGEHWIRTLWGDFLYQLGEHRLAVTSDNLKGIPDRESLTKLLSNKPVLILLDELPKYLAFVKDDPRLLDKVKHFLHALSLAVCDPACQQSVLVVSIASDVYQDAADEVRRELKSAMAVLGRKMQTYEPVTSDDIPKILRKRLLNFDGFDTPSIEAIANSYLQLYESSGAPDRFRTAEFKNRIIAMYPFHPELIDVLYERVATIPEFQRTRGALRLLSHVIGKVWRDKEADAYLIQPHHIDLSSKGVVEELTTRLKEDKFKNAIESDVFNSGGKKAKAQSLDGDYVTHYGAPLYRRACNVVYLYTLTGAKIEAKGIDADNLVAVLATPGHEDHVQWYRDSVLPALDKFWYVERVGNRFFFAREAGPLKVIDQEAENIPPSEVKRSIEKVLSSLFSDEGPGHFDMTFFPDDPGTISDDTSLKLAVLNPMLGHFIASEDNVPEEISSFILYRDSRQNPRHFRNDTFLLVPRESGWGSLQDSIKKLEAAKAVLNDPEKYNIPLDKKKQLQQMLQGEAGFEANARTAVRAAFTYLVYIARGGKVEAKAIRPNGYGSGKSGQDVLWHIISDVLGKVKDEPLDPDYVKSETWPSDVRETTTKELFERVYSKPGVILPKNQPLFEQTIQKGVETGLWVLMQGDEVYSPEDVPSRVIISSDALLLTPEEAGRKGITDQRGHKCKNCLNWPCTCGAITATQPLPILERDWERFESMMPTDELKELDVWIRREGVEYVSEAEISLRGTSELAPQFRNLIRLCQAGRTLSATVKLRVNCDSENTKLHCEFQCNEKGLTDDSAKLLDDVARWSISDFEGTLGLRTERWAIGEFKELLKTISPDPTTRIALTLKRVR